MPFGGGPVLVRDGKPVYRANEAFTVSQIAPRHPRTAVGQTADGRLIFAVVDGRQPGYSVGMTTYEMALTMVRLGAVRAMQLDGGGSSTLAFDGRVLNSPSDGRERPVPTALMLQYYGVYAPPPLEQVVSPNGDGVAETQELSFKVVRPSTTTATLTAPDGTIAWQEVLDREAGTYEVAFPPVPVPPPPPEGTPPPPPTTPLPPAEGRWTLTVSGARRPGPHLHDDSQVLGQLDAGVAPGRARPRRRHADRRQSGHSLDAGARRPGEGHDRDRRGHRGAYRLERIPTCRRAGRRVGRPRREPQARRNRALRRPRDGHERARRRLADAVRDRAPGHALARPTT